MAVAQRGRRVGREPAPGGPRQKAAEAAQAD